MTDEKEEPAQEQHRKARRRLLKLGVYLGPSIVSLSAFVGKSNAQGRIPPIVVVQVNPNINPNVRVTVN